jgi:hypothetical protein
MEQDAAMHSSKWKEILQRCGAKDILQGSSLEGKQDERPGEFLLGQIYEL